MARAIDWTHDDQLKAQGLGDREIARPWEIPWSTFHREKQRYTQDHSGTPEHTMSSCYTVHPSTPRLPSKRSTTVHPGTPAEQPTVVHPRVPVPNDLAVRLLSLLPDLEVRVARERDRQRLLSTPIGTLRHTTQKTYVVDMLYVDLIDRYAQAEGVERTDVVNLAFHEVFARRQYLPVEE